MAMTMRPRVLFAFFLLGCMACGDVSLKEDRSPTDDEHEAFDVTIVFRNQGDRGVTYFTRPSVSTLEFAHGTADWLDFIEGQDRLVTSRPCGSVCDGGAICNPPASLTEYLAPGNEISRRWDGRIWQRHQERTCDYGSAPEPGRSFEVRVCWGDSMLNGPGPTNFESGRPAHLECLSQTLIVGETREIEFEIEPSLDDFERYTSRFTLNNSSGVPIFLQSISQCQGNAFFRILEFDRELKTDYSCECECGTDCADCALECLGNEAIEVADGQSHSFSFSGSHFLLRGECGYIIAPAHDELQVEVCFGSEIDAEVTEVLHPTCIRETFATGEDLTLTVN